MTGDAVVEGGERARAIAGIETLLRILRQAVDCFPGDDLETILVYLTVGAASSGRHLRDLALIESLGEAPLPDHLHRATSGRSIALSTGLPRETVRRRIKALVEAGRLVRDGDGVRTASGSLTHNRNLEFVRFLVRELDGASTRLARYDV